MVKTVNTPTGGNDKLNSIMEQRNELSDKEQSELLTMLQKNKKDNNGKENLIGDTDAILNDLRKNHVKIEENVEMMGFKGKKVHIDLPAVGNFEGFKFDYFVSDNSVRIDTFESNPELTKKSYSMNDVSKLLKAMNGFMAALECDTDGNMKYENDLKEWKTSLCGCSAGDYLKVITGLDSWYWLSDKDVAGRRGSCVEWDCTGDNCYFARYDVDNISSNYDIDSNLFLRLSD